MIIIKLGEAYVEISADQTKLTAGLNKAQKNVATSMKAIGKSMTIAGAAIVAGFGMAIKTAAKFEKSMALTASVASATSEELKELSDYARKMGEQSVFSASQAADGMYYLASAGMNVNEVMGALEGTLALAAATQSDLAYTSESVASALSQFSLDADEATRVANVYAAAISGSQATMEKLTTSMSYVGPMAKSMGMTIEDTTGILMGLYNAGIPASTAGTALRMAFVKLIEPTTKGAAALDGLKVSVVDSSGAMRPFKDIIDDLGEAGMTTADAMAIFGIRSGPAMMALVSQGTGAIQENVDAVTDTEKAYEMAAMQIDTFEGAMKLLRSAFEELQITLVQDLMPSLKGMIEKITEGIKKVSDWMKENPKLTETIVKWTAAIGALMLVLGPLLMILPGLVTGIGLLLSPIGLVFAAVGLAIVNFTLWWKVIAEIDKILHSHRTTIKDVEEAENILSKAQEKTAEKLGITIEKYREYLELGWTVTEMIKGISGAMEENIKKTKETAVIQEFYNLAMAKLKEEAEKGTISFRVLYEEMKKLDTMLKEGTITFDDQIQKLEEAQKAYDVLQDFLEPVRETIKELTKELTPYEQKIADVNAKYDDMIEAIKMFNVTEEIQKEKIEEVNKARDLEITKLEEEKTAMEELIEAKKRLADLTKYLTDKIYEFIHTEEEVKLRDINREYDLLIENAKEVFESKKELIEAIKIINEKRQEEIDGLKEGSELKKEAIEDNKDLAESYKELKKPIEEAGEATKKLGILGGETWEGLTAQIKHTTTTLNQFTKEGVAAAIAKIKMHFKSLIDHIRETSLAATGIWARMAEANIASLEASMTKQIGIVKYGYEEYLKILAKMEAAGGGGAGFPSYQFGTPYVPKTGLYKLHEGERVTPANQNTYNNSFSPTLNMTVQGGGDASLIAYEVKKVLDETAVQFRRG
ncbi:hypothetical protein ES705_18303 [subsurface metagenome]